MLFNGLGRSSRGRQRAQGLVEYGLVAAVVAFVGVAGLNLLTGAQKAYFGDLPLASTPPAAPGALLHPTAVDAPVCAPGTPTPVATQIQCTTTVHDTFSDPTDRNPPLGTIHWLLDNVDIGQCPLPTVSTGAQNACAAPFAYTPVGASMIGNHVLVATYMQAVAPAAGSNHVSSPSPSVALQFTENLQFNTACVNEVITTMPAGQVEIGHPLHCSVTLMNLSSGTPTAVASSKVTWSVTNAPASGGVGMFTCAGSSTDLWTNPTLCPRPMINPSGIDSITCTTDVSGKCSVIYRHLYDSWLGGAPSTATLTLAASSSTNTYAVKVVPPVTQHVSGVVALCTSVDPNVNPISDSPTTPTVSFPVGGPSGPASNALFQGTHSIQVFGGLGTQLNCTATVVDTDPNPAATTTNPNLGDAHPPLGTVTFKYNGVPIPGATCNLRRSDIVSPPTQQAVGQAPFVSTCSPSAVFSVSGTVGAVPTLPMTVEYGGEPPAANGQAHASASASIPLDFDPPPPGPTPPLPVTTP